MWIDNEKINNFYIITYIPIFIIKKILLIIYIII